MKIYSAIESISEPFVAPIMTMGNFDGVHFGHQYIFRLIQKRSQQVGGTSIVITFDPHPQKILYPQREFYLINRLEEKIEIIREIGIDVLICIEFTRDFASQNPKEFVRELLVKKLHVQEVYVGYDSRFGRRQQGTPEALSRWGQEFGFRVTIVPPITHNGIVVSSTKIRQLIRLGLVEQAAFLLNRHYAIDGRVISGTRQGSTILGYPTANINVHHELIPKEGVYIGQIAWKGKILPALINIGTNPTVHPYNKDINVEAHILDFHENLYGEQIKAMFLKRIRDEIAFSEPRELVKQIKHDIYVAEMYFRDHDSLLSI